MSDHELHVIHGSQLPTTFPVTDTLVVFLIIVVFDPPGWASGIVGICMAWLWCLAIDRRSKERWRIVKFEERDTKGNGTEDHW